MVHRQKSIVSLAAASRALETDVVHESNEHQEFDDYDDFHDFDEEPYCRTCCGDGWVESVAAESGRYGWDDDGPGKCPNCRGSGLLKG